MANQALVRASILVNETYKRGYGGSFRHVYIHDVLERASDVPKPVNAAELAGKLTVARATIEQPPTKEVVKALRKKFGRSLTFDGEWGYEGLGCAADLTLAETGLGNGTIANIATSELDAEWALSVESPSVITDHASLIMSARGIAGYYHRLDIWRDANDPN
jgi:hypothetical protein